MLKTKLYYSYGADSNLKSMRARCPLAKKISSLKLPDYKLVFRHVADIERHHGEHVEGVLWQITDFCEKSLDRFEGYPHLYDKHYFMISMDGEKHEVMFYTMNSDDIIPPSPIYYDTCLQGYTDNKLDVSKIKQAREESMKNDYGFNFVMEV